MVQQFSYWHNVRDYSSKCLGRATFPSSQRRARSASPIGRSLKSACAEGADGVVRSEKRLAELTTIEASPYQARASRPARQLLSSCRATPPLRGGEFFKFFKFLLFVLLTAGIVSGQASPPDEKIKADVRTIQNAVNEIMGTPVPGGGVLQVARGAYLDGYGIVVSLEVAFDPPVNPFTPQKSPEEIRTTATQRLKEAQEKLTSVLKQKVALLESIAPSDSVSVILNILNTNPAYLPDMPSQVIFSVKKQDTARVSIKSYK